MKAEFQRIARRDKKAFLRDQCKEIEANNRMGKTRDIFKKIRDTKGTFHAKMGTIKNQNGMDLTAGVQPWWIQGIRRWGPSRRPGKNLFNYRYRGRLETGSVVGELVEKRG